MKRHVAAPRARRAGAALAFLALLLGVPAVAQQWAGRGRMSGTIKDDAGKPLAGAKITLRKDGTEGLGPAVLTSDEKGQWSYLGLANGAWTVLVEAAGFVPAEGSIAVSEFSFNPPVNMQLRKVPEDAQPAAEGQEALLRIGEGNTALGAGRYAEARAAYEAALPLLEPKNHPPVLRGIARAHYQEGHLDAAIETLDKALALEPANEETLRLAIDLLVAGDREEQAKGYLARLPQGAKVAPETLLNMGIQAYNDGDAATAVTNFSQAIQDNPELADAYYYRGLAYLNQGDKNVEALADFEKLLALEPGNEHAAEVQQFIEYLKTLQ